MLVGFGDENIREKVCNSVVISFLVTFFIKWENSIWVLRSKMMTLIFRWKKMTMMTFRHYFFHWNLLRDFPILWKMGLEEGTRIPVDPSKRTNHLGSG